MAEQAAPGKPGTQEITVRADMDQLKTVTDFVNRQLTEYGCSNRAKIQLDVVIDEVFCNIARYAYGPEGGTVTVRVMLQEQPGIIAVTFLDRGRPFNPLEKEMPDTTRLKAKERPIGGLGLFMVKRFMDSIAYDYQDGQNVLTMQKKIR